MSAPKFTVVAASLVLAGCVSAYPHRDLNFGQAVTSVKAAQTLYPEAGRARDPALTSGIDGRAARETMDRYVDTFKTPPPTINVLNIGGGLSQ